MKKFFKKNFKQEKSKSQTKKFFRKNRKILF